MLGPIRVVLADESRTVRLLLASLLREDGRFDVVAEVATGAEALERSRDADLVIVDLVLQDTDGFTVIADVRAAHPHVPVVVFTAVDPPYLRAEAEARGATGYFPHGTDPADLLDGLVDVAGREGFR